MLGSRQGRRLVQPKFDRFAISKALDICLVLAVMFGFDVSLRVKLGDVLGAILLAGMAAAGGLAELPLT